jgi:hypothetical protein
MNSTESGNQLHFVFPRVGVRKYSRVRSATTGSSHEGSNAVIRVTSFRETGLGTGFSPGGQRTILENTIHDRPLGCQGNTDLLP